MAIDPVTASLAAARAAIPLMSFLGRSLRDQEAARVRAGFVEAMRQARLGDEKRAEPRWKLVAWAKRKYDVAAEPFPARRRGESGKLGRLEARKRRQEHEALAGLTAGELTAAWNAAPLESLARTPEKGNWSDALLGFLVDAAGDGLGLAQAEGEPADPAAAERRERLLPAWRYVVGGDPDGEPSSQDVAAWARQVADAVVLIWVNDPRLSRLVAQLNFESGYGLVEAIAASSRDVAQSLRQIAAALPLSVLGGGVVALLVLFVDKG